MTGISKLAFWLQSDSLVACEIGRLAGFDVVIFDVEHGVLSLSTLDRLVPFCAAIGLETYIRTAESSQSNVQAALDLGPTGVILPQLVDADHATKATSFAKYPPLGRRGIGFNRTMAYSDVDDHSIDAQNKSYWCFAMIETPGVLRDAKTIAALPTVDGLFAGPGDLSLSMGRGIFKGGSADLSDLRSIAAAAQAVAKSFAVAAPNRAYRQEAQRLGASFIGITDELSAMREGFVAMLR